MWYLKLYTTTTISMLVNPRKNRHPSHYSILSFNVNHPLYCLNVCINKAQKTWDYCSAYEDVIFYFSPRSITYVYTNKYSTQLLLKNTPSPLFTIS